MPAPTPLDTLRQRAAAVITGRPEDAYDTEFARAIAVATPFPGGKAEVLTLYRRLQDKFKRDFQVAKLKALVDDERKALNTASAGPPPEGWETLLLRKPAKQDGEYGGPAPCESNAVLYFTNLDAFRGKLAWNEFSSEHEVLDDLPPPINIKAGKKLEDHHDTRFQIFLQQFTREPKWNIDAVRRAVDVWAKETSFHPVKKYLDENEPWDGVHRLPGWLHAYCGAGPAESDDSPESEALTAFISAIAERWMISAVARIYEPGCKVDHVLVLEGLKGIGKSTLVKTLFDPWAGKIKGDISTKDNMALLSSGVWCLELDELDVLPKSDIRSIRSWVTDPEENFRPVWGRRHVRRPRQVVFLATVNGDDWAMDEDRRWWPVTCRGQLDLEALKRDRNQLWAEALHKYKAGIRWHFDPIKDEELIQTARKEQAARVSEDVNADKYLFCANQIADNPAKEFDNLWSSVSVSEILDELKVPLDRRRSLGPEVGRTLKAAGWALWKPRNPDSKKHQLRRYRKPE